MLYKLFPLSFSADYKIGNKVTVHTETDLVPERFLVGAISQLQGGSYERHAGTLPKDVVIIAKKRPGLPFPTLETQGLSKNVVEMLKSFVDPSEKIRIANVASVLGSLILASSKNA